jgi:hypothetical protein
MRAIGGHTREALTAWRGVPALVASVLLAVSALLLLPAGSFANCYSPGLGASPSEKNLYEQCLREQRQENQAKFEKEKTQREQLEKQEYRHTQEAEEQKERENQEVGEAARRERELLNEKKETGGPPTFLKVKAIAEHGHSYRRPGKTQLLVLTSRFAQVWIKVSAAPYEPVYEHFRFRPPSDAWGPGETDGLDIFWSCSYPMLKESYVVRVRGERDGKVETGPGLTATGYFVTQLSRNWCRVAKHREGRHHG